ncbi:hypothetical protein JG687_00014134 [Phytophthora cactorum]|uniref:Uncharacterized protein n=1 Tax=Phytophthora cactorum TaxID=29920 RepID=A0A8T1TXD0_9STRA|nr:hypothetical protein JG687_00014134 [Phytophthora cactorum]
MYQDQYMKWCLESVTAPRSSFIRPELIVEPSVPSYPVENLPFVRRLPTGWAKLRFSNDVTMARGLGICAVRPPKQRWGSPRPPATAASAGCGDEDSFASGAPLTAHTSS